MSKPQTFAEITAEQVAQWKETFHNVYLVEIEPEVDSEGEETARYYMKPPSVAQINAISEISNDKKHGGETKGMESMRAIMILGGDMKYLNSEYLDSRVYLEVNKRLEEVMGQKKGKLKRV